MQNSKTSGVFYKTQQSFGLSKKSKKSHLLLNSALAAGGLTITLLTGVFYGSIAQAQTVRSWGQPNRLLYDVDGKLTLKVNLGLVQNFASEWQGFNGNGENNQGQSNATVGFGGSFGWTHRSGFGLSADYLGFGSNWQQNDKNYSVDYHVITFTPSYRVSFGAEDSWGLKFGLGLGLSVSDVEWSNGSGSAQSAKQASGNIITANNGVKVASGAAYSRNGTSNVGMQETMNQVATNTAYFNSVYGNAYFLTDAAGSSSNNYSVVDANGNSYNLNNFSAVSNNCIALNPDALNANLFRLEGGRICIYYNRGSTAIDSRNTDVIILEQLRAGTANYVANSGLVAKNIWRDIFANAGNNGLNVFAHLISDAGLDNLQALASGESATIDYRYWTGANLGSAAANQQAFENIYGAAKGLGSFVYGQYAKTEWKSIVSATSDSYANALAFQNLLTNVELANFELLNSTGEDININGLVWALNYENDFAAQTALNNLVAPNQGAAGAVSQVNLSQIAKTDWVAIVGNNTTDNANLFKTILQRATAGNFEKLTNGDSVNVGWRVWTGLNLGSSNLNQSAINALKGPINSGNINFALVEKSYWQDVIQNVYEALTFRTLLQNAGSTGFETLVSGEVITVPYEVWSELAGATDAEKQNQILALQGNGRILFAGGAAITPDPNSGGSGNNGNTGNNSTTIVQTGSGDVGFVITPEIAVEYDNGLLHADLNFKYYHALKNVKHNGQDGASDKTQLAGPLALFIGAGFGINF